MASTSGASSSTPSSRLDPVLASQIDCYRHVARGIAPSAASWEQATGEPPLGPVLSSAELTRQASAADANMLERLRARQQELHETPAMLPDAVKEVVAIERQLPYWLVLQRRMWSEVLGHADGMELHNEAQESLTLRRVRRARQPRELRESERLERKRSLDADAKRKQRREEFLAAILRHGEDFRTFHKESRRTGNRLAKAVLQDFDSKARREAKEREKGQRERLKALRENNLDEYMKLINDTKNERLKSLIEQTDNYLRELGEKVQLQKEVVREAEAKAVQANKGKDDDDDDDVPAGVAPAAQAAPEVKRDESHQTATYSERSAYYSGAHAVKTEIKEQPQMLKGGQLKEYQMQGLRWMVSLHNNSLNGILADEMGLGKTIQTIALISYLMEIKEISGPFMVIVPLAVLSNWELECRKWIPDATTVAYKGSPDTRKIIWEQELNQGATPLPFNVLLTTYELIMKDKQRLKKFKYRYIIIDEGHRMKNAAGKLAAVLQQYESQHRILLTGTPLQNSLGELWALLNFLLPKIFSSADTFETWFSAPLSSAGGTAEDLAMTEEESLLVINRLHQVLRPFLLRRMKSEVETQLPGKAEYVVKCELSAMQKVLYRQVQEQGLITTGADGQLKMSGLNNVEMHLRKVCNHPYLFLSEEQRDQAAREGGRDMLWRCSGKFELLDRILPKLHALGHRVLIFSQFVLLMDLLQDYFNHRGYRWLRLDGNTKGEDRGGLLAQFNAPNSPYFVFMLSTRAGGLGLNLQTADTVVLFDSDWNPQMDLQAMARAHRIGQKQEVRVLRLVTATPIEEKILATANEKLDREAKIIEAGKFNQTSNASERREMLQRLIQQAHDDEHDPESIPQDEDINEMLARANPDKELSREEELERYAQLDEQRVQQQRGAARLCTELELPPWLRETEQLLAERRERTAAAQAANPGAADDELAHLLGEPSEPLAPRERRTTGYREELSERDWNRLLQSGLEKDEFLAREEERKRKIEERRERKEAAEAEAAEAEEEQQQHNAQQAAAAAAHAAAAAAAAPRKKAKKDDSGGGGKGAAKKKRPSDAHDEGGGGAPPAAKEPKVELTPEREVLRKLINAVANCSQHARKIAQLFTRLPQEAEAPGYYSVVHRPICINDMKRKLDRDASYNLAALDADMQLMVDNAHTYNAPDSQVHVDATTLLAKYGEAKAKYAPGAA